MKKAWLAVAAFLGCLVLSGCEQTMVLGDSRGESRDLSIAAQQIEADLARIRKIAHLVAAYCQEVYKNRKYLERGYSNSKYTTSPSGIVHKVTDDGGSAFLSTGIISAGKALQKARVTEFLDPLMIAAVQTQPEIVQVYFNDRESVARIYPYFDVTTLFEPGTDVQRFNFYYLADAQHNPYRTAVWVNEPYVDPAGRGWLISAIAPVYVDDQLQGVAGIDITLHRITRRYLADPEKRLVLVDSRGLVIATESKAAKILQLPPLLDHKYIETIKSDTFRSEDFNLLQSPNRAVRAAAVQIIKEKQPAIDIIIDRQKFSILTATIDELDWTLWQIVPK